MTKSIGQSRLLQEMKSMVKDKSHNIFSQPLENDLFIWHFTILGPENTDFHEGIYHGQIVLPFEYPFKPPDIYFFTKNGRFEVSTKICLTITQYHPQQWNAGWTIRTMLEAVISLFNQHVPGVGYVEATSEIRKSLAQQSKSHVCQKCGPIINILTPRKPLLIKQSSSIISSSLPIDPLNLPIFKHESKTMPPHVFQQPQKRQQKPSTKQTVTNKNTTNKHKFSLFEQIQINKMILLQVTLSSKLQKPQ